MGRKRKDTFQSISIEYIPIDGDFSKGITMMISKQSTQRKLFHEYQKMFREGEKRSKKMINQFEKSHIPIDYKVLCGETIKLMIEDTLIPLLNPSGEHTVFNWEDKDIKLKLWGQQELITLCMVLKYWGSNLVQINKYRKSDLLKMKNELKLKV